MPPEQPLAIPKLDPGTQVTEAIRRVDELENEIREAVEALDELGVLKASDSSPEAHKNHLATRIRIAIGMLFDRIGQLEGQTPDSPPEKEPATEESAVEIEELKAEILSICKAGLRGIRSCRTCYMCDGTGEKTQVVFNKSYTHRCGPCGGTGKIITY